MLMLFMTYLLFNFIEIPDGLGALMVFIPDIEMLPQHNKDAIN